MLLVSCESIVVLLTDWTMAGDAVITATGNVVGEALGGDIGLGVITGENIGLTASGSVIDANAGSMNITATNLSLVATGGSIGSSDTGNINADANDNAIDITISTLAANADSGIYVSETDGLIVTTVAAVTVDIESVVRVNFNSTTTDVSENQTRSSLEDLSTTTDGPVKLISLAGSLTINGGSDSVGVSANGDGDVLIEARGAGSDVIINADVISGTGNITLDAGNDLDVNAALTIGGSGTIYLTSVSNTTIDSQLTSNTGDILVESGGDITQTASITSTSGDVA